MRSTEGYVPTSATYNWLAVPLTPGAEIELDIEKAAAGGRMLARHAGQVVLVGGAIPGEHVRARIQRVARGVTYADTVAVLTPSPDRRAVSGDPRCGGQVLAHIGYDRQVRLKAEIIQDAFRRIARVPLASPPPMLSSREDGYRMRARLHVQNGRIGFFLEGTHQVCDAAATGQLSPGSVAWIAEAETALRQVASDALAAIDVSENIPGTNRAVHLEFQAGADPRAFTTMTGATHVSDTVDAGSGASVVLRRDVRAFFQGNRYLIQPLVEAVLATVGDAPIVDLYAGVGLFGLAAAAAGRRPVTLVEGDPISGADLERNAEPFGKTVTVRRRSVESFLASSPPIADATVVADPPRTGMSREAVHALVALRPARLVYVSCDIATLARDVRTVIDAGYDLESLTGVDMFPNTAHVESIAVLTRST